MLSNADAKFSIERFCVRLKIPNGHEKRISEEPPAVHKPVWHLSASKKVLTPRAKSFEHSSSSPFSLAVVNLVQLVLVGEVISLI